MYSDREFTKLKQVLSYAESHYTVKKRNGIIATKLYELCNEMEVDLVEFIAFAKNNTAITRQNTAEHGNNTDNTAITRQNTDNEPVAVFCKQCGNTIVNPRKNQTFCVEKCKNRYNNNLKKQQR